VYVYMLNTQCFVDIEIESGFTPQDLSRRITEILGYEIPILRILTTLEIQSSALSVVCKLA